MKIKDMTLREVCNAYGVSRRAVQGYEMAGLVSASSRNERGYLLYDENAQKRIKQIKLFQQMGFTIKEIKSMMDTPEESWKPILGKRVKLLEKKKKNMEMTIDMIYALIEKL